MPEITPITAPALSALKGIAHGFFTREGGASQGLYASLNCGLGSRDEQANILKNRERVARHMGTEAAKLVSVYQIHSAKAVAATGPWQHHEGPQADAIVTNTPGLAISVLTADCAPVLLADTKARVVAAAHAGWRGALEGILDETVSQMEALGAKRGQITAAIGPTISLRAYEVGDDFKDQFLKAGQENSVYFEHPNGAMKPHFDLPAYVSDRLEGLGLARIEPLNICTYAQESRLFSYRRSVHKRESDYGRQISAILLA